MNDREWRPAFRAPAFTSKDLDRLAPLTFWQWLEIKWLEPPPKGSQLAMARRIRAAHFLKYGKPLND